MRLWSHFLANLRTHMGHHVLEYKSPFSISVFFRNTALEIESALGLINHSLWVLCIRKNYQGKNCAFLP